MLEMTDLPRARHRHPPTRIQPREDDFAKLLIYCVIRKCPIHRGFRVAEVICTSRPAAGGIGYPRRGVSHVATLGRRPTPQGAAVRTIDAIGYIAIAIVLAFMVIWLVG
jgi:hypothetical protein